MPQTCLDGPRGGWQVQGADLREVRGGESRRDNSNRTAMTLDRVAERILVAQVAPIRAPIKLPATTYKYGARPL